MPILLLFAVFVIATCGLIYELIAGTLASYLLGDSVTQFSTIIGVYLFSMGVGSFFSKYIEKELLAWFVKIEILVGLVGGTSSSILFLVFDKVASFQIVLYFLIGLTGILVGLEIPLLMRVLEKSKFEFKEIVSKVFTFDYIGALLASVLFPLIFVPYMGLIRTSFFFGIFNTIVALIVCHQFSTDLKNKFALKLSAWTVLILLLIGFLTSDKIMSWSESMAYQDKIIFAKSSHYQRIVLTRNRKELKLYLNGNLQFCSTDEYRYHEALVHPGMSTNPHIKKVLVLGGGDGLAVRELLKYKQIQKITLVDLDAYMTDLFKTNTLLTSLNQNSLMHPKVNVINTDAFQWVRNTNERFDFIVIDFPDPSNFSVGKLYTNTFYREVGKLLNDNAVLVVQSTSPYVAPKSFWCVNNTLQSIGLQTQPYHCYVPSFGEWGYVLASKKSFQVKNSLIPNLKFLTTDSFDQMAYFPKDMQAVNTDINKLNNQILVHYFEEEWGKVQ
ncbi:MULTISPECIES: polyamine aminopropyltransferase [unclassified Arcicella]|uniref:polyamine aminopropyltransferase n=1 Tax=unclassified Arcicella TaxID=2644986 RepID=UPI0028580B44|nr:MULTISPECIES: polyamine aminopropyltransferase [unclassified Arcicella]MDR6561601.1 spermidine synthase [Arcicella sp. BE51]MDR6812381.1 spermidine synthase [Arcicella sp. BE140]MDR6823847.1 spermidine synthase [Arcicella sp. BE139]